MKFIRRWLLNRQIDKAVNLLAKIDKNMAKMGMPRYKRRQIRKDFLRAGSENLIEILKGVKL